MAEQHCLIAIYQLKMVPKVCVHCVAEFEMIQISLLKQIVVNVQKHSPSQKRVLFLLYSTTRNSVQRVFYMEALSKHRLSQKIR